MVQHVGNVWTFCESLEACFILLSLVDGSLYLNEISNHGTYKALFKDTQNLIKNNMSTRQYFFVLVVRKVSRQNKTPHSAQKIALEIKKCFVLDSIIPAW